MAMSYPELNKQLDISDEDYQKLIAHVDAISNILSKYKFKRDTEYRDEAMVPARDDLKTSFNDFKWSMDRFTEDREYWKENLGGTSNG